MSQEPPAIISESHAQCAAVQLEVEMQAPVVFVNAGGAAGQLDMVKLAAGWWRCIATKRDPNKSLVILSRSITFRPTTCGWVATG